MLPSGSLSTLHRSISPASRFSRQYFFALPSYADGSLMHDDHQLVLRREVVPRGPGIGVGIVLGPEPGVPAESRFDQTVRQSTPHGLAHHRVDNRRKRRWVELVEHLLRRVGNVLPSRVQSDPRDAGHRDDAGHTDRPAEPTPPYGALACGNEARARPLERGLIGEHLVPDQGLQIVDGHPATPSSSSSCGRTARKRSSAREVWLFTVPGAIPRASATWFTERSSR